MNRIVFPLAALSVLLFACNISPTATPAVGTTAPVATIAPVASETITATEPAAATDTPAPQANATCNEASLHLDPTLASGFSCQTVAEVPGDPNARGSPVNPQYTKILLTGYTLSDQFFAPHIDIYPIQRFSELLPDSIPIKVAALQALLGGGPTGAKGLPFLLNFNAAQELFVRYKIMPFGSGNGIR